MSKDKLWNLCDECIGDLQDCDYEITPLEMFLPTIGICDMCKAAGRRTHVAVRKCAIGKRKRVNKVDRSVGNLVKSVAGDSAATLCQQEISLN